MSLWDNFKKIAQPYGDDEYEDEYEDDGYMEEEEETPRRSRRNTSAAEETTQSSDFGFGAASATSATATATAAAPSAAPASTGFSGTILNTTSGKQEVVLFRPTSFSDTTRAADDLRSRKAVVVNMENVDKAMARRVVDFLSGCAYAVDGKVKKIAQATYLFCPHNMEVVGDLENVQNEIESYM